MPDFISLTCPTCGGKLQITNNIERFACGYCGNEHLVRRSGGMVTIEPVIEGLKKIQEGTDKTASELAIQRLQKQIDEDRGLMQYYLFGRPYDDNLKNKRLGLWYCLAELVKPRGGKLANGTKASLWMKGDNQGSVIANASDAELEEAVNFVSTQKKSADLIKYIQQVLNTRRRLKQEQEELMYHEAIVQRKGP